MEGLQLAVVATAARRACVEYTRPAMTAESPLERLWGLCEYFLSYVQRKVFPGGCFFSAVVGEAHALPEAVGERLRQHIDGWLDLLTQCAREAMAAGELHTELEPEQIDFEVHALIIDANRLYVFRDDPTVLDRAWAALARLLGDPTRRRRSGLMPDAGPRRAP